MGQVLYGDIEKEKLIIYLNKYIQDCYPKLFSLEEAKKIYNALLNIDTEIDIIKIWLSMTEKNSYSETIENKLCGLEQLKNDKKLNEILSVDDKIIKNNVFSNMIEEIMLCFYKLAMKSYVK